MAIKVIGRASARKYRITCTDESCRALLEFDQDDVRNVNRSSMGRVVEVVLGISCPECRQVLPLADASPEPAP